MHGEKQVFLIKGKPVSKSEYDAYTRRNRIKRGLKEIALGIESFAQIQGLNQKHRATKQLQKIKQYRKYGVK